MIPRAVLGAAGLAALVLPLPEAAPAGVVLTLTGLVALGFSLLRPGSGGPAVVIAAAALSWLDADGGRLPVGRLAALALALGLVHSSAALAAVVPARAPVPAALLLRWAGWTLAATAVGGAAVAAAALLPATAPPVPATLIAVVAVTAAGALAALAGRGLRRRAGQLDGADGT